MADHDQGYKQLFSNPELVRDLLQGFVLEDWVDKLDMDTLERVNGSYISDDLREREDDIIWRVQLGDSWVYVYLLIEFQSTVDRYMALRLLTYLGLLYQDLQKSGALLSDGKLPPVLPLVFNICFLKKTVFLWMIFLHIILSALFFNWKRVSTQRTSGRL